MEKNYRLRILNILGGSKEGGAEKFFERISLSLAKDNNVDQEIIIRKSKKRFERLKDKIKKFTKLSSSIFLTPFAIDK